ncbi:unnamed protein product, partial [Mesorhabditis spiculigera]
MDETALATCAALVPLYVNNNARVLKLDPGNLATLLGYVSLELGYCGASVTINSYVRTSWIVDSNFYASSVNATWDYNLVKSKMFYAWNRPAYAGTLPAPDTDCTSAPVGKCGDKE